MQFELSGATPDAATLATALRPLDPDARLALDIGGKRLEVLSDASSGDVLEALRKAGYSAELLEQDVHISGGSTCCGGCS